MVSSVAAAIVSATASTADSAAAATVSMACEVAIAAASIIVSLDSPASPLEVLKVSLNNSESMPADPFSGMGDFIAFMMAHPLPSLRTTVAPPVLENPAFVTYPLSSSIDSKVENPPPVGSFFRSPMKKVEAK